MSFDDKDFNKEDQLQIEIQRKALEIAKYNYNGHPLQIVIDVNPMKGSTKMRVKENRPEIKLRKQEFKVISNIADENEEK